MSNPQTKASKELSHLLRKAVSCTASCNGINKKDKKKAWRTVERICFSPLDMYISDAEPVKRNR